VLLALLQAYPHLQQQLRQWLMGSVLGHRMHLLTASMLVVFLAPGPCSRLRSSRVSPEGSSHQVWSTAVFERGTP
jgi:hypothetical protein